MVIWGLTVEEADIACKQIKAVIKDEYSGSVRCVSGRQS
jgi:hypothetical protein